MWGLHLVPSWLNASLTWTRLGLDIFWNRTPGWTLAASRTSWTPSTHCKLPDLPGRVVYMDELKQPKNRNNSALFGYMQFGSLYVLWRGFSGGSAIKNLPATQEAWAWCRVGKIPGEANSNPLQYSCLGNPMDGGAWWATVHGVTRHDLVTKPPLSCSLNCLRGDVRLLMQRYEIF